MISTKLSPPDKHRTRTRREATLTSLVITLAALAGARATASRSRLYTMFYRADRGAVTSFYRVS